MNLQSLAEQLFNEINIKLEEAKAIDASRTTLEEADRQLKLKQERLVKDVLICQEDWKKVEQEKEYVEKQLEIIKGKETLEAKLEVKRQEIKLESERVEKEKQANITRKQELDKLEEKEKELNEKEELLRKATMDNLVRKQRLDDQESDNEKEKQRLQAIATRLGAA